MLFYGETQHKPLVIRDANVWRGKERGFVQEDLLFENGKVVESLQGEADQFDAGGKWVIPGLIDAHFHAYAYSQDGIEIERGALSLIALNGSQRLGAALRRGFTTVRDVAGGDIGLGLAIQKSLLSSPRYLFTGPALSQTGGHGDPRLPHIDLCLSHGHLNEIVDGVDNIRLAVRERLRTGAHAIKMHTSGGVFSPSDPLRIPQYSAEEIRAAVDEATRRGTYVTAHAYSSEAVLHSIENGVRCIEHGNLVNGVTVKKMAELGTVMVPTLATYAAMAAHGEKVGLNAVSLAKNNEVLSEGKGAAQQALAAGVLLGFGTDLMGELEFEQLKGVEMQVEALGAKEALHSMTEGNATIIGDNRLGNLNSGSFADALVLNEDPIRNPESLWSEESRVAIFAGGQKVSSVS